MNRRIALVHLARCLSESTRRKNHNRYLFGDFLFHSFLPEYTNRDNVLVVFLRVRIINIQVRTTYVYIVYIRSVVCDAQYVSVHTYITYRAPLR